LYQYWWLYQIIIGQILRIKFWMFFIIECKSSNKLCML
jgi:hypothetical protein